MARYEHLPIYRAAFDLAVHVEKIVESFSLNHKYTLGSELRAGSRRVLRRIIESNEAKQGRDRGRARGHRAFPSVRVGIASGIAVVGLRMKSGVLRSEALGVRIGPRAGYTASCAQWKVRPRQVLRSL